MDDIYTLPADLPIPQDDGAADHLPGATVPELTLPSTAHETVALAALGTGRTILVHLSTQRPPRRGRPRGLERHPGCPRLYDSGLRFP